MFYVDALNTQSKILMVQLCVYDCRARIHHSMKIEYSFIFSFLYFFRRRRQFVRLINLTHLIHSVSVVGIVC